MTMACLAALLAAPGPALATQDCLEADFLFNSSLSEQDAEDKAQALEKALALCSSHMQSLNNLAVLREQAGRLDDAESLYRTLLRLQPDFVAAHAGLGDVLTARHKNRAAAEAYRTALDLAAQEEREGYCTMTSEQMAGYRQRLRTAQERMDITALVTAEEITHTLAAPPVTGKNKRGIRVVKHAPRIDLQIHFDVDSDQVKEESLRQIDQIAQALQGNALQQARILIEGHTDADGDSAYNRELSRRRAARVQSILTERFHLAPGRFLVAGHGKEMPIAPNDTPQGKALNRRVTFTHMGTTP
ncbi:MAG: OmpA family protein [Magnetococcales bacterium]|nr:OmpA family protein [Magnetococcales bacterium]